jgi:uncharacterized membrane protein YeaQ/YmgE (transglycosylase-associated protein family)
MTLAEIFQRRRRIVAWLALPWLALGLIGVLFAALIGEEYAVKEVTLIAAFAMMMVGALMVVALYRCPACNKVPDEDGIVFNPTTCPKCGVPLKAR